MLHTSKQQATCLQESLRAHRLLKQPKSQEPSELDDFQCEIINRADLLGCICDAAYNAEGWLRTIHRGIRHLIDYHKKNGIPFDREIEHLTEVSQFFATVLRHSEAANDLHNELRRLEGIVNAAVMGELDIAA